MITFNTKQVAKNLTSKDIEALNADCPEVKLQEKSVEYTQNAKYEVIPDEDYDGLSKVDVTVSYTPKLVPLLAGTIEYPNNHFYTSTPYGYDGIARVGVYMEGWDIEDVKYSGVYDITAGSQTVKPSDGYIAMKEVNFRLPPIDKSIDYTVTENGSYEITPTVPDTAMQKVNLTVNVPSKEEETKSVSYTANGSYTVQPTEGKTLSEVSVEVNVPSSGSLDITSPYVDFYSLSKTKVGNSELLTLEDLQQVTGWDTATDLQYKLATLEIAGPFTIPEGWFDNLVNGRALFLGTKFKTGSALSYLDLSNWTQEKQLFPKLETAPQMFQAVGLAKLPEEDIPMFQSLKNAQSLFANTHFENNGYLNVVGPVENINYCLAGAIPYSDSKKPTVRFTNLRNCTEATDPFGVATCTIEELILIGLKTDCSLSNCLNLSEHSVQVIVDNLGDVTSDPKSITFAATPYSYITEEQKTAATAKGWTINQA